MTDELPDGWTYTTVADLVDDLRAGFASGEKNVDGGVSQLRMNNIGLNGELVLDLVRLVPEKLAKGDHFLTPGDVLVCTTNSGKLVGKCAYFDLPGRFTFSNHLTRLRPKRSLAEGRFLRWALWSSWKSGAYEEGTKHWVNQSAIPKEVLSETEVALPPIAEQQRIVEKLEKLLAEVEQCKERMAKIPVLLKRFRQSVLAAACSGRLTADWREENPDAMPILQTIERLKKTARGIHVRRGVPELAPESDVINGLELPETWGVYSAAELLRCGAIIDIKDGNHGANHPKVSEFTSQGLPFITAAQVNNFRIDYDGAYKLSGEPLNRIRVGRSERGDVIYTHKGSVGRVAISEQSTILTPQTTYYRVFPEAVDARYLMFYLASPAFSEQVNVIKEQTTRDFVPISDQYLLFHRLPPLDEQKEIGRRVQAMFAIADRIESRFKQAAKSVESLTQSALSMAFRGELVPTEAELAAREGRDYESAARLLERIRVTSTNPNTVSENGRHRRSKQQLRK